jgi:hypothetical protein
MANNGFDTLKEALQGSDQFNLHQLNDLQQMVKDFGLDASDVAMGNRGDMVVDLVDSNNASLPAFLTSSRRLMEQKRSNE